MEQYLVQNYWFLTLFGTFFAAFAVAALVLATVGVAAVVAHNVSRRRPEIGVRIAVGASAGSVLRLFIVQGMRPVVIGLIFGLVGAFVVTRFMMILIRVSPTDPLTFVVATSVLMGAATLGCGLPAWSATQIDPVSALRHE